VPRPTGATLSLATNGETQEVENARFQVCSVIQIIYPRLATYEKWGASTPLEDEYDTLVKCIKEGLTLW